MKNILEKITKRNNDNLPVRIEDIKKALNDAKSSGNPQLVGAVEFIHLGKPIFTKITKDADGSYAEETLRESSRGRALWALGLAFILGILFGTFNFMSIPARARSAITMSRDVSERNRQLLLTLEGKFGEELTNTLLIDDAGLVCAPKDGVVNCATPAKPVPQVNTEEKK